jgi:hypothetical protein
MRELPPITIIVTTAKDANGRPLGKGRFTWAPEAQPWRGEAAVDTAGQPTPTPLIAAARWLLSRGAHPTTPIILRHADSPYEAIRGSVGAAASMSVQQLE